jgi:hypothetical protein
MLRLAIAACYTSPVRGTLPPASDAIRAWRGKFLCQELTLLRARGPIEVATILRLFGHNGEVVIIGGFRQRADSVLLDNTIVH